MKKTHHFLHLLVRVKYLEQNNKQEMFELLKQDKLSAGEYEKTRKNQSKWRLLLAEEMMGYTTNENEIFCPLTYITVNFDSAGTLFRASHIKGFADCNVDEAFDINNGIIMVANADALFDKHLITIEDEFYNIENLKKLYIKGNLSSVPNELYKLKNLKYLYINGTIYNN